MTRIIAVINQKGGVGKTATSCNLSHCYAKKYINTLLIDLDPSANATRIFFDGEPNFTTRDFLSTKHIGLECVIEAEQGEEIVDYLNIIPSHISLALAERELGHKPFRETLLSKKIKSQLFEDNIDVIILDCPPTLTTLTVNAMYAADLILVPVTYAKDALEGVGDLFDLLGEIKDGHAYQIQLLRNQYDARRKTANNLIADHLQPFIERGLVLNTIIRQDEEVNKACFMGLTVMQQSPLTNAAQDYMSLCDELEAHPNA